MKCMEFLMDHKKKQKQTNKKQKKQKKTKTVPSAFNADIFL